MEKQIKIPQKASEGMSQEAPGHSMAPPVFSLKSSAVIQRNPGDTPGRGLSTDFGTYWIVPNDTTETYADVVGEQITEAEFAKANAAWTALKNGTGKILISEKDKDGGDHGGFKTKMLTQFAKLMSKPTGRGLVIGLVNGSQTVTIRPTEKQRIASASRGSGSVLKSDGSANTGGTTTINIDDNLSDDKVVAFDKDGKEIASPVFLILGHELIHAVHNAAGKNKRNLAASASAWGNKEEEETIATGDLTENDLRAEHDLGVRFGHGIKVK